MNKKQIWEILQCCLLATDGADISYLEKKGFNVRLGELGIKLFHYLKDKELHENEMRHV